jgi:hypothetical protein
MTEIEEMWTGVHPKDVLFDEDVHKLAVYADEQGCIRILQKYYGEDDAICLHAADAEQFLLAVATALFKAQRATNKINETYRAHRQDDECKVNRCAHCFRSPTAIR